MSHAGLLPIASKPATIHGMTAPDPAVIAALNNLSNAWSEFGTVVQGLESEFIADIDVSAAESGLVDIVGAILDCIGL